MKRNIGKCGSVRAAIAIAATAIAPIACIGQCWAVEIRLKQQCAANSAVVTLGDVAEVAANDPAQARQLAATELFPTPALGEQKFASVHEIQDLLLLRGLRAADFQFSGSNQVVVLRSAPPKVPRSVVPGNSQSVNRRVSDAITRFLNDKVSATQDWSVEVALPEPQAKLLSEPGTSFSIRGGRAPYTGSQQFEVTVATIQRTQTFPVLATVRTTAPCVVATHNLPRGTVIRESDVEIQRAQDAGSSTLFHAVEEVVGRETMRGLTAGKPVSSDDLRTPLVVHRGDIVTVYVNSGGIRIRTNARAKAEGSVGELIAVESMLDRSSYYAKVSGIREVEVFAYAPQAESAAASENEALLR